MNEVQTMSEIIDQAETNRRFERFAQLYDLSMNLAVEGIKHDYPHASPEEVNRILRERLAIMRKEKWKVYESYRPPQRQ